MLNRRREAAKRAGRDGREGELGKLGEEKWSGRLFIPGWSEYKLEIPTLLLVRCRHACFVGYSQPAESLSERLPEVHCAPTNVF